MAKAEIRPESERVAYLDSDTSVHVRILVRGDISADLLDSVQAFVDRHRRRLAALTGSDTPAPADAAPTTGGA